MCLSSEALCVLLICIPLTGSRGPRAAGENPPKDLCFSTLFSYRFFEGFLKVLASILDDFWDDFRMFFA